MTDAPRFRYPIGVREILGALADPLSASAASEEEDDLESWLSIRERFSEDFFSLLAQRGNPTGTYIFGEWAEAPEGYLMCDGSLERTTSQSDLFDVIGYRFGGSGTEFARPDLRGRVLIGLDNMGGTAAGRVSGATALGVTGGVSTVTLAVSEMPAHTHSYIEIFAGAGVSGGGTFSAPSSWGGWVTGSSGGGAAHQNMPPYLAVNVAIKT